MKLIDLLVKKTEQDGWVWPDDTLSIAQDDCGLCWAYDCENLRLSVGGRTWRSRAGSNIIAGSSFTLPRLADDWNTSFATRAQYEAAIAKNDGWIEWGGGGCPVPQGTLVDVRYRCGKENHHVKAGIFGDDSGSDPEHQAGYWGGYKIQWDIIAYRLHRDINSRANDDRLEQDLKEIEVSGKYLDDIMNIPVRIDRLERDLNECIGQEVDVINHPSHYTRGSVECIDAIASATVGKSGIEAVCVANAIKYLWRYEEKNGIEDVKKAAWYLNKLISELEAK